MNTYIEGWRLGLKAIAIYRDGSKRSAPLNTRKTKDMGAVRPEALARPVKRARQTRHRIGRGSATYAAGPGRSARCAIACPTRACRSPTNSRSRATKVTSPSGSTKMASRGELFIQMSKEGSTIGGLMDTVATLTSMALQYGVPLEAW